jgi:2-oxoglutarate ferredoxin oxidoreductase subunit alpha
VLHYDGTPITARFIAGAIAQRLRGPATPKPSALPAEPPQAIVTPAK